MSTEVFGRPVSASPAISAEIKHKMDVANIMGASILDMLGWSATATPKAGDAAYMLRHGAHHIGIVAAVQKRLIVAHVVEGLGFIVSDRLNLIQNQFKIEGFFTYAKAQPVHPVGIR